MGLVVVHVLCCVLVFKDVEILPMIPFSKTQLTKQAKKKVKPRNNYLWINHGCERTVFGVKATGATTSMLGMECFLKLCPRKHTQQYCRSQIVEHIESKKSNSSATVNSR